MRTQNHVGGLVLLLVLIVVGIAEFARGIDALMPARPPAVDIVPDVQVSRLQAPAGGMGLGFVLRY